jgi:predicted metal-dependent hydrolase
MNWRLIQTPQAWIDYVAAHEVAHLRQMNHSAAFWNIVATLVSDYAERRAALRRDAARYLLL